MQHFLELFSVECVIKPEPNQLLWTITTDANGAMNQSEFKALFTSR